MGHALVCFPLLVVSGPQVWELDFDCNTGFAKLAGQDDDTETWASNQFSLRCYITASTQELYIKEGERHVGSYTELTTKHHTCNIPVIPAEPGSDPVLLNGAVFEYPTPAGHVWFNLHKLHSKFKLAGKYTAGTWYQKKKSTFLSIASLLKLGDPTT